MDTAKNTSSKLWASSKLHDAKKLPFHLEGNTNSLNKWNQSFELKLEHLTLGLFRPTEKSIEGLCTLVCAHTHVPACEHIPLSFFFFLFRRFLWHMEVPSWGSNWSLQPLAYSWIQAKPRLWPMLVTPDPYSTEWGQGLNLHSHRDNIGSLTHWAILGTPVFKVFGNLMYKVGLEAERSPPLSPRGG